ncbi:hypothetical protein KAU34_02955 [candidate division WOR-3 bacterium]|nr:hypothetical protein [candidate division WOR-3 bacterium]
MKISVEIPRKILYVVLFTLLVTVLSISAFFIFRPQIVRAEWNNDNTSTSDSYTLSQIERHLENLVRQLEKLNNNLSGIEDEIEKIRSNMD